MKDFDRKVLISKALEAQKNSYAPYSHYNVGAVCLAGSGEIYTGVNVENASYPAGICAERNAISTAVSQGEHKILAIAICGGKDFSTDNYCTPCGICRQVMREFGNPGDIRVIMAKSKDEYIEKTLEDLLPDSFGPDFLK